MRRRTIVHWLVIGLCLLAPLTTSASPLPSLNALPPLRRVNVPGFGAQGIQGSQMAIFWFGRVTRDENYIDARVGYDDQELIVNLTVFDRNVLTEETPGALTQWDGATLYLDLDGNTGNTLDTHSIRFDAETGNWSADRSEWQAIYRGSGTQWQPAALNFRNESGVSINDDPAGDDRGWIVEFHVPFSALNMSGPPAEGTIWGLAIAAHDRDSVAGPARADQVWPETMNTLQPITWGQLRFGKPAYQAPATVAQSTVTVRQGVNGASVPDADVGGHTDCGAAFNPNFFDGWGDLNYAGSIDINVQNQANLGDWPCFSKYYVTFPLTAVPTGKTIVSATLTLYQFGNTGGGQWGAPADSYVQVFTVDQAWNENTLTWNNAPLARENVAATWVYPLPETPHPDEARNWDVSGAVAEAVAAHEPLRLAVYSADMPMQTGRYFRSSDFDMNSRPQLTIIWGDQGAVLAKSVWPVATSMGQRVTYTLSALGGGHTLTVTDDLPDMVSAPASITASTGAASYDPIAHRVSWSGLLASGQPLTVTIPVTVLSALSQAITNRAVLTDAVSGPSAASAVVIANGYSQWLPLIHK